MKQKMTLNDKWMILKKLSLFIIDGVATKAQDYDKSVIYILL